MTDPAASATAIGGTEPITLRRSASSSARRAEFLEATFLQGRGMNLDHVRVHLVSRYVDDCFVDLQRTSDGHVCIDIVDPAASSRMRLTALSPHVQALQLYSRPNQPFVVIEPQFNVADPFSTVCPPRMDTGMVVLRVGAEVTWRVRWELLDG